MQKVTFENGVILLMSNNANGYKGNECEISLTIKAGHQNTPLGLAAVYEGIVAKQAMEGIEAVYGGNLTSFYTGGSVKNLPATLKKLWFSCNSPTIDEDTVHATIADIVQHTRDLSAVPDRQTRLAYKHTAFQQDQVVWDPEEYIRKVEAITVEDVRNYIDTYYVGSNIILGYSGPEIAFDKVEKQARKLFADIPAGKPSKLSKLNYTGGYQELEGNGVFFIGRFGWDISDLDNFTETNVLMNVLDARLERELAPLGVTREIKIAGYFGLRTMRVSITATNREAFEKGLNIVCANISRLRHSEVSVRRLETSRTRTMNQNLSVADNSVLPRSVYAAWLELKGRMFDRDRFISNVYATTAHDLRDKACDIFGSKMTTVLYGYSITEDELLKKMQ
ncbi:MAG: insulinase family protein [Alphaproteobacteria bacterium]|nr:insulinase family protein [Alphaproteobacteria bacterium]